MIIRLNLIQFRANSEKNDVSPFPRPLPLLLSFFLARKASTNFLLDKIALILLVLLLLLLVLCLRVDAFLVLFQRTGPRDFERIQRERNLGHRSAEWSNDVLFRSVEAIKSAVQGGFHGGVIIWQVRLESTRDGEGRGAVKVEMKIQCDSGTFRFNIRK